MINSKEPRDLKDVLKLDASEVQLKHLKFFPAMTGWFEPTLLLKLLLNVIISKLFGQYADRRLTHAALDKQTFEESRSTTDLRKDIGDDQGEVLIDYVADLGDGFDATYAVAYALAQPSLTLPEFERPLPRAHVLVMGGDQVYPTAARDEYIARLRRPYEFAWPKSDSEKPRPLLVLPGNHDWYDGLVVFLALFCRSKSTRIGNWATRQRRSYFSARVTNNWYIWGIDIALVRDMDQPQADYFVDAANNMPDGANIILCSAEPGWYEAEKEGDSFRTLGYASQIAENADKHLRIPLVLSGDSHHYARYQGANSQFITSGGGGAFVHGTLELKDSISTDWLKERDATLSLQAEYPSKEESRRLLREQSRFFHKNPGLSYVLGSFYAMCCFVLTQAPIPETIVGTWLMLFLAFWGYFGYQEGRFSAATMLYSAAHALVHFAAIVILSTVLWLVRENLLILGSHWLLWALVVAFPVLPLGARIGGWIFGKYLQLACLHLNRCHNDAFSAMRLDTHRHFLRMRIVGDVLTICPICIDQPPSRAAWQTNDERSPDKPSLFVPPRKFKPRLLEPAIVIAAEESLSSADVDPSAEIFQRKDDQ